jgi:probable O-glycosylation ligase (exosortase A-associated)
MNPHQLAWGFARGFPFAQVIAGVTLLAWVISREPKRLPWHPITLWLAVFTVWISFTTLFAESPDYAHDKWDRTLKILAINGFLTLCLINSRRRLDALIWVIVISVGFFGVKGGIFTILGDGRYLVYGPGGMIGSNGSIGLSLIMIIPLAVYLISISESTLVRYILMVGIALSIVAILGTWSRGALVGLSAMVSILLLKTRRKLAVGFASLLVLTSAISFMPEQWYDRMGTITSYQITDDDGIVHEDASAQGRIEAWRHGVKVAMDRPILGGGFEVYRNYRAARDGGWRSPHSIIFEILAEQGFVGLAIYLALAATTWRTATSILRLTDGQSELRWAHNLAAMTQVSLVGYFACGLFLNQAYLDLYYHLVVIMAMVHTLVRKVDTEAAIVRPGHATQVYQRTGSTTEVPERWGQAAGRADMSRQ